MSVSELESQMIETCEARSASTATVLGRAFDVLGTFSAGQRTQCLSDISQRAGMPKSTTHRVLQQLAGLGVLERHGNTYRIGVRIFSLGALSAEEALREAALPFIEELNRASGYAVNLAVVREMETVYLERLRPRRRAVTLDSIGMTGARLPAHCTAAGKAILAFSSPEAIEMAVCGRLIARTPRTITDGDRLRGELARIASTGVAIEVEESYVGLSCVASPVGADGQAFAAISIAFPLSAQPDRPFIDLLRQTARNVSRAMARTPMPGYF